MSILKPDQYIGLYTTVKQMNPNAQIVLRQYERRLVDAVDHIVEMAHGERDSITSENDWKVFEELLTFFATEWPHEYMEFKESIPSIRQIKGEGYSESREIKHVGSIPPRLMKLTRAIFPSQVWDKKFVNKLVKRFPLFKVGSA